LWKEILVIYDATLSSLALVTRHANHIFSAPHFIVICGLSVLPYFSHYLINGKIFGKENYYNLNMNIKYVF